MAWKRSDWNDIIQRINALDCINTPLEEVPEDHIWIKNDITLVRNKLTEICINSPTFDTELVKWKQDIIDEINAAIDICECCDPREEADIIFTFDSTAEASFMTWTWLHADYLLSLAKPGVRGRRVKIEMFFNGLQLNEMSQYGARFTCEGSLVSDYLVLYFLNYPLIPGIPTPTVPTQYLVTLKVTPIYTDSVRCVLIDCETPEYRVSLPTQLHLEKGAAYDLFVGSDIADYTLRFFPTEESIQTLIDFYNQNRTHSEQLYISSVSSAPVGSGSDPLWHDTSSYYYYYSVVLKLYAP